jgi:hypothetical protein
MPSSSTGMAQNLIDEHRTDDGAASGSRSSLSAGT